MRPHVSHLRRLAALTLAALLVWIACLTPLQAIEPVPVAPGVYAFLGTNAEAAPENGGFVGNSGFIVSEDGVVVIDTGGSLAQGEAMLEAIGRVTSKPVKLVVITHAIQDFVFGASAFSTRGIPLLAHRRTVELMKARCEHCLENLRRVLGEGPLLGTRLAIPNQVVEDSITVDPAGRAIDLVYPGWASTPGDLLVFDRRTRTLFAGGVITASRIPELRDGDNEGWARAVETIKTLAPLRVVPGYGAISPPEDVVHMTQYLRDLDTRMRMLYAEGVGLTDAIDGADLPPYRHWALYPDQHRRNALRRYLQLEVEDLERQ